MSLCLFQHPFHHLQLFCVKLHVLVSYLSTCPLTVASVLCLHISAFHFRVVAKGVGCLHDGEGERIHWRVERCIISDYCV